jgi:hypothetical protein
MNHTEEQQRKSTRTAKARGKPSQRVVQGKACKYPITREFLFLSFDFTTQTHKEI